MKALLKGIIIAIVTVGVVVPAGYFSTVVYHSSPVSISSLVPQNSTMVVRADYNGTNFYLFNNSSTNGVVIGISLTNFDSELAASANQTNGTSVNITPTLYAQYRGYSIYMITNVSLNGLIGNQLSLLDVGYNLTPNLSSYLQNDTLFVAEVSGVVSVGSLASVKMSVDALVDNTNFNAYASAHFNDTANVSVYFKSSDLPIQNANANVYYLSSDFNIQFNNTTNAQDAHRALGLLSAASTNYTFFPSYGLDGTWLNGTMAVGIGNYYLLQNLITNIQNLLSQYNINYTKYLTGSVP